jgi:hypothetical protein
MGMRLRRHRDKVRRVALRWTRGLPGLSRARRVLKHLDPCEDPAAERVSTAFLVAFALAAACSVFILFRYEYEPSRDGGFHASCVRILHDRNIPGSVVHDRYEPMDAFSANTLFYSFASVLAKVFDPYTAFKLMRLEYFLGLPMVTLYALRRLGRSPWGALLAFPMAYAQAYAGGFVNFTFGAPLLIAALLAHWLFLERPTVRRGAALAVFCALAFLSHAHVYLWLGALLVPMSLYGAGRELGRLERDVPARLRAALKSLLLSAACAVPSVILFGRWYWRFYGPHRVHSEESLAAAGLNTAGPHWLSLNVKMIEALWGPRVSKHEHEGSWPILAAVLVVLALSLAQREKRRSPPFFELCGLVTLAGYFYMPDDISGQQFARRYWDMGLWLVPFFVTPVLASTSRWARAFIICAILALTFGRLRDIQAMVRRFNVDELAGFDAMIAAAPHEDLLVAWSVNNVDSPNVIWLPWAQWHQIFAARTGLEAPLYVSDKDSNAPVHYRLGPPAPPTLIIDTPDWGAHPGLWDHYDLVLVKGWHPNDAQLGVVREHAVLLASSHEWQLWRRIGRAPRPMEKR